MAYDFQNDSNLTQMRVALIHYWLVGMRGGEKVLESLCRMFPQADIYTHVIDPKRISSDLNRHPIYQTRVGRLPFARRLYQKYLPFMPRALEELDLSQYDLVISSEAGPAKGVIVPPDAAHLCYCHSPMRYIWDQYPVYNANAGFLARRMLPHVAHHMRQWDVSSASRVDRFVANSKIVSGRIKKYWRRGSSIVHPPVEVQKFAPSDNLGDFYLWVGNLAPYKRPDLAIDAFKRLDRPLVVIGGPDKTAARLAKSAGVKTTFLGEAKEDVVRQHMARCKALIFPGEEDFGIVPVEVMASGRPVIAFGRGGALDSVLDQRTGLFFYDQSVQGLIDAVERFESSHLMESAREACVSRAQAFSEPSFHKGIRANLAELV
ncbi:glycosyltransferase [Cognatishimia activa]|uniref:D-inositol 3-phosphate glycosyltransferase n=1 Tax=Cognatishimia activa TaxID=1715691 RepID=A0A0P1IUU8_9RHOB|nr:glycosyltransferase [Cognatishimia activa]CUI51538.1 D-inositol 3-phosphate glycosyltransferase [Cognatishimia activa]CUK27326.1 D-inositol 3-phosphate glycosyltransferase [Cognatishimia activa]